MPTTRRDSSTRRPGRPRASSVETIHEAGAELFLERGFEHTSIDDIAKRAGVSRGTFFAYCDSKADVLWAELDAAVARASDALDERGPAAGADAVVEMLANAVEPWGDAVPWVLRDAETIGATASLRDGAAARLSPLIERVALALALERDSLPESPSVLPEAVGMVATAAAAIIAWAAQPQRPPAAAAVRSALRRGR